MSDSSKNKVSRSRRANLKALEGLRNSSKTLLKAFDLLLVEKGVANRKTLKVFPATAERNNTAKILLDTISQIEEIENGTTGEKRTGFVGGFVRQV